MRVQGVETLLSLGRSKPHLFGVFLFLWYNYDMDLHKCTGETITISNETVPIVVKNLLDYFKREKNEWLNSLTQNQ